MALIAVFGAGVFGKFVPPWRSTSLQFAALLVPITSLGLLVVTAGWAAAALWVAWRPTAPEKQPRSKVMPTVGLLLHAGLAAVAAVRLGLAPGSATLSDDYGQRLDVLTLNAGSVERESWLRMTALMESQDPPEVVALQEGGHRVERPGEIGGGQVGLLPLLRDRRYSAVYGNEGSGVSIFTRLPIMNARGGPLSAPEVDDRQGQYVRAEVLWQGRNVAIYSVHLRSFNGNRPWTSGGTFSPRTWRRALDAFRIDIIARAAEAIAFRRMLESEPLPFIVCGDLNTTPDQWGYARLGEGLNDVLDARSFRGTYPASTPLVQIDAVLSSSDWSVEDGWVGEAGYSDHRPIHGRFILRRFGTHATDSSADLF